MYESVGGAKGPIQSFTWTHSAATHPYCYFTKQMTSKQDLTTQNTYIAGLTNALACATILNDT